MRVPDFAPDSLRPPMMKTEEGRKLIKAHFGCCEKADISAAPYTTHYGVADDVVRELTSATIHSMVNCPVHGALFACAWPIGCNRRKRIEVRPPVSEPFPTIRLENAAETLGQMFPTAEVEAFVAENQRRPGEPNILLGFSYWGFYVDVYVPTVLSESQRWLVDRATFEGRNCRWVTLEGPIHTGRNTSDSPEETSSGHWVVARVPRHVEPPYWPHRIEYHDGFTYIETELHDGGLAGIHLYPSDQGKVRTMAELWDTWDAKADDSYTFFDEVSVPTQVKVGECKKILEDATLVTPASFRDAKSVAADREVRETEEQKCLFGIAEIEKRVLQMDKTGYVQEGPVVESPHVPETVTETVGSIVRNCCRKAGIKQWRYTEENTPLGKACVKVAVRDSPGDFFSLRGRFMEYDGTRTYNIVSMTSHEAASEQVMAALEPLRNEIGPWSYREFFNGLDGSMRAVFSLHNPREGAYAKARARLLPVEAQIGFPIHCAATALVALQGEMGLVDSYLYQVTKKDLWVGTCLEFPDLETEAPTAASALKKIRWAVGKRCKLMRKAGAVLPAPRELYSSRDV